MLHGKVREEKQIYPYASHPTSVYQALMNIINVLGSKRLRRDEKSRDNVVA